MVADTEWVTDHSEAPAWALLWGMDATEWVAEFVELYRSLR